MTGRRTTRAPADTINPGAQPGIAPEAETEEEAERGPFRRCLVTRERLPKEAMIRFVLDPDRNLVPDLAERLPGRGMWLSARADVIEQAARRGAFAKASRGEVHVPPELRARIEDGLRGRVRDLIGFARRAGQAVSGWHSAREWLQVGRAGLLVQAADGSPAERFRLVGHRQVPVVAPLDAAQLGAPFGRDRAVHVAIASGRLAERIAAEAARLVGVAQGLPLGTGHDGATQPRGGRRPGDDPVRRDDQRGPRAAKQTRRDGAAGMMK
ncbi:MAG TPA: RNA-binding protein [Falsiroseomonas sp.]|jgi:hypothetical protein|nr:RNA-binding protein [Falsiroseomonas sp.]